MPAPPASSAAPAGCANALVRSTAYDGSVAGRKLADMPPAYLMRAVLRESGGCVLDEVRTAPGVWRNLSAGPAASTMQPAARAPIVPPR
jgi:hypothetical protein